MKIIVFGDIHGKWHRVNKILQHEFPSGAIALSTGDLGNYNLQGNNKLIFTPGNHESYTYIEELRNSQNHRLTPLRAGQILTLNDGTKIGGFPGVYSPTFFVREDGPEKYWKKSEMEKILSAESPDIFISHEAPFGIGITKDGKEVGSPIVRDIIERLKPRMVFCGHHHIYLEAFCADVPVHSLAQPNKSYLVLETNDFSVVCHTATMNAMSKGFEYSWEGKV